MPELPGAGTWSWLAVRYSQSDWLAEELVDQHTYDFSEAFFEACQRPAPTDLQINTLKIDDDSFAALFAHELILEGLENAVDVIMSYLLAHKILDAFVVEPDALATNGIGI